MADKSTEVWRVKCEVKSKKSKVQRLSLKFETEV